MSLAYDVAPRDVARLAARDDLVERRLRRFRPHLQKRVHALAARHPHLADLAVSFPALLLALAFPRRRDGAEDAIARVIQGAPLKTVAHMARAPLWLRRFRPEAFAGPLPALPDSAWFAHRVGNHIPPQTRRVQPWLTAIAEAYEWADDIVALWVAREMARQDVKRPRRAPRGAGQSPLRLVSLWAWHSLRGEHRDLMEIRWSRTMEMNAALAAARDWRENLVVTLDFSDAASLRTDLPVERVGPYELHPLVSAEDIIEEAREMKHCVRSHSMLVAHGLARVWSIRENGERVATLMVGRRGPSPLPEVQDLRRRQNTDVTPEMWMLILDWLRARADVAAPDNTHAWAIVGVSRRVWTKLWRRYWLAKRRIPAWLPLTPDANSVWSI